MEFKQQKLDHHEGHGKPGAAAPAPETLPSPNAEASPAHAGKPSANQTAPVMSHWAEGESHASKGGEHHAGKGAEHGKHPGASKGQETTAVISQLISVLGYVLNWEAHGKGGEHHGHAGHGHHGHGHGAHGHGHGHGEHHGHAHAAHGHGHGHGEHHGHAHAAHGHGEHHGKASHAGHAHAAHGEHHGHAHISHGHGEHHGHAAEHHSKGPAPAEHHAKGSAPAEHHSKGPAPAEHHGKGPGKPGVETGTGGAVQVEGGGETTQVTTGHGQKAQVGKPGGGSVEIRPEGGGTVTVQPTGDGGARVDTGPGGTAEVQPTGGGVTVRPEAGPQTEIRPGQGGSPEAAPGRPGGPELDATAEALGGHVAGLMDRANNGPYSLDEGIHYSYNYEAECKQAGQPNRWKDDMRMGYANPTYFERVGFMDWILKPGMSASAGIKAWLKGVTVAECNSSVVAMEIDALRGGIGDEKFDEMFGSPSHQVPNGQRLRIKPGTDGTPVGAYMKQTDLGKKKSQGGQVSEQELDKGLKVGQWYYFYNHPKYLLKHPGGAWQGENSLYMGKQGGQRMWSGLGASGMTEAGMFNEMVSAYNAPRDENDERVLRERGIKKADGTYTDKRYDPHSGEFAQTITKDKVLNDPAYNIDGTTRKGGFLLEAGIELDVAKIAELRDKP